jgi:hypothetical protein
MMDCGIYILVTIGIVLILWCFSNQSIVEGFNPWLDYSRAYPGTFSYKYGYGPFFRPFYNTWPGTFADYQARVTIPYNIRYNPGYSDYWYIPAHQYLNRWINAPLIPTGCIVPPKTSEYCVNAQIQEHGNLDYAISNCVEPPSISEACPSLKN